MSCCSVLIPLAGDVLATSCSIGHSVHQLKEWNMSILRPELHPVVCTDVNSGSANDRL